MAVQLIPRRLEEDWEGAVSSGGSLGKWMTQSGGILAVDHNRLVLIAMWSHHCHTPVQQIPTLAFSSRCQSALSWHFGCGFMGNNLVNLQYSQSKGSLTSRWRHVNMHEHVSLCHWFDVFMWLKQVTPYTIPQVCYFIKNETLWGLAGVCCLVV